MTMAVQPYETPPAHARVSSQAFLDYTKGVQTPERKAAVLEKHYETIAREMQARGTWREQPRLLDLGCGLGVHAEFWHARGFRVTGLDHDADLIAHARKRAEERRLAIRYEEGRADRLPFADGSFDIIYANSILEHVENWARCLEEWIRVLAPGGLLWIETTNGLCPRQAEFRWLPLYSWWPPALKRLAVRLALGPLPALANHSAWPALHWFSYFQLKRFLEPRGLSVRDRFDCMDIATVGWAKRLLRRMALSGESGRRVCYLFVSPLVVLATKTGAAGVTDRGAGS